MEWRDGYWQMPPPLGKPDCGLHVFPPVQACVESQSGMHVAVPLPVGDKGEAQTAAEVTSNDLLLSGFFKVIDAKAAA